MPSTYPARAEPVRERGPGGLTRSGAAAQVTDGEHLGGGVRFLCVARTMGFRASHDMSWSEYALRAVLRQTTPVFSITCDGVKRARCLLYTPASLPTPTPNSPRSPLAHVQ